MIASPPHAQTFFATSHNSFDFCCNEEFSTPSIDVISTESSSIHGRFLILIYIILVCFCTLSGSAHAFLKIIPLYQARAL